MEKHPRVLVVSHNIFSRTGNMGRTMANLLSSIPSDCLAQLYFHSEIPTMDLCHRYFRITDRDVLRSVVTRKAGYRIYGKEDIREDSGRSRTDQGLTAKVYQFSRRRTPAIYCCRNWMWRLGKWESEALDQWIRDFAPDVIFFASGDYVFPYRIVERLSQRYHLPVVTWCCDDYYIGKRKSWSPLYHLNYHSLMRWAHKVEKRTLHYVVICDKMKEDYQKLFHKPMDVLRISVGDNPCKRPAEQRTGIVYAGNLGLNRVVPLLELAAQVKKAGIPGYEWVDVYSGEGNPKTLALLTEENGIRFHGAVPAAELTNILGAAKFVLHVEAFDEKSACRTRYSLSTKIGESLQSGACILAYAPRDIASMEYLREYSAAVCLERAQQLPQILRQLTTDREAFDGYVARASELAKARHSKESNDRLLQQIFMDVCKEEIQ